jgi:hypothetical protein
MSRPMGGRAIHHGAFFPARGCSSSPRSSHHSLHGRRGRDLAGRGAGGCRYRSGSRGERRCDSSNSGYRPRILGIAKALAEEIRALRDRVLALRLTDVFALESGPASWKHAPTLERCPRQAPLGRNRLAAFTLCYKVSGPSALPPHFEPVDQRERDGND